MNDPGVRSIPAHGHTSNEPTSSERRTSNFGHTELVRRRGTFIITFNTINTMYRSKEVREKRGAEDRRGEAENRLDKRLKSDCY